MCIKHWYTLPKDLQLSIREDRDPKKKGQQSLRATPTNEWLARASNHVGPMYNVTYKVDATSKVNRKVEVVETPNA